MHCPTVTPVIHRDTFQDLQWTSETADSTEPCVWYDLFNTYVPFRLKEALYSFSLAISESLTLLLLHFGVLIK